MGVIVPDLNSDAEYLQDQADKAEIDAIKAAEAGKPATEVERLRDVSRRAAEAAARKRQQIRNVGK